MLYIIDSALAQQIVDAVKDVCGYDVNFISRSGLILASTDRTRIGSYHEIGEKAALLGELQEVWEDRHFAGTQKGVNLPVYYKDAFVAVIGISGDPGEVKKFARLAERITLLLIREKELGASSRSQEEKKQYLLRTLSLSFPPRDPHFFEELEEFGIRRTGKNVSS